MQFSTLALFTLASIVVASPPLDKGFNSSVITQDQYQVEASSVDVSGLADASNNPIDDEDDVPDHVARVIDAVKVLAENTVEEIEKIAQSQDIPLDELIPGSEIYVSSTNKRSVDIEARGFVFFLPLVKGLAKVVLSGVASVSDAAQIPILGSLLKGAASFL